jgi:hypothetical protein
MAESSVVYVREREKRREERERDDRIAFFSFFPVCSQRISVCSRWGVMKDRDGRNSVKRNGLTVLCLHGRAL